MGRRSVNSGHLGGSFLPGLWRVCAFAEISCLIFSYLHNYYAIPAACQVSWPQDCGPGIAVVYFLADRIYQEVIDALWKSLRIYPFFSRHRLFVPAHIF